MNDCDCLSTGVRHTLRGMSKSVCVYASRCQSPLSIHRCFISRANEATIRLDRGFVLPLSPTTVQLKPPPGWSPDRTDAIVGAWFSEAWKPRWSSYWLVWQTADSTLAELASANTPLLRGANQSFPRGIHSDTQDRHSQWSAR